MIIGTAGHIDHGKSALVRALTGKEMDRLAEERRRGITIDLNFAPLHFPGMPPVGVVDVPGHEDFVRTMVAGASGIELVLLVVDAGEGPMPQTLEHLAIVEQLGVARGIPVLTKCDLVESVWVDLIEAEFAPRLAASSVAFGPPARVSAHTGQGIDALRERIHAAVQGALVRRPGDLLRMPIDRAFSLAGVGTVLTGTTWSGTVSVGDLVRLLPSGLEGRVRSVASHGEELEKGMAGTRVAVGVAGIERGAVHRGETLVSAAAEWQVSHAVEAMLHLLAEAPRPIQNKSRVRVHLGTGEVMARVHVPKPILPGESGLARLSLETPLLARAQDRIVLRSYSPVTTIGGGVVIDPLPPRRLTWSPGLAAESAAERLVAMLARRAEGIPEEELPQLLGVSGVDADRLATRTSGVRRVGTRWVESASIRVLEAAATAELEDYHRGHPASDGLSVGTLRQQLRGPDWMVNAALDSLQKRGEVAMADGRARLAGFRVVLAGGESILDRITVAMEQAGLAPPTIGELAVELGEISVEPALKILAKSGTLDRVTVDRYFAASALNAFREAVAAVGIADGEVTPAALRDRLGVSRKFLIPLLEWSDRQGITRREGERRLLVRQP